MVGQQLYREGAGPSWHAPLLSLPGLDLSRRFQPLRRPSRRPFTPESANGPYRLPGRVSEALARLLAPFRNREAAYALATFLGRHWASYERLGRSFVCDRRALANHPKLGLSESKVRGALRTLERVGFLDRPLTEKGSRYQPTEAGLQRKPVFFLFGALFASGFQAAQKRKAPERKPMMQGPTREPVANSPKNKTQSPTVHMGEERRASDGTVVTDLSSSLESALMRLGRAILSR